MDQTNWKYRHLNTYGTVIVKMLVWIITRWSCVRHWYWFEGYHSNYHLNSQYLDASLFSELVPLFLLVNLSLVWMCSFPDVSRYTVSTLCINHWQCLIFFIRTCHHIGSPLQISQGLTFFKSLVDFRVCTVKTHLLKMNFVIFFKAKSIEYTFKYW